jgi:acetylornithine deacetylase
MVDVLQHLRLTLAALSLGSAHPLVGLPTWSVGTIHGGTAVNIVPDRCVIEIDRRLVPGETPDGALAQVDEVLDSLRKQRPDISVQREPPDIISWPLETDSTESVVRAARAACERVLGSSRLEGASYGSDASLLSRLGRTPSIVIGPGDIAVAHGPDEYLDLEELDQAVDLYEALALSFDPIRIGDKTRS